MKIRVSHRLLHRGCHSLTKALDAAEPQDTEIHLDLNKNIVGRPFVVTHSLTIQGKGLKKTVIYLTNSTLMLHLEAGNLHLKDLTVILSANSCLLDAERGYRGRIELNHVRVYHEPSVSRGKSIPDMNLVDTGGLLPAHLSCFDCQLDCLYAGVHDLELTHCLIGDLWGKSGLIGAFSGVISKSVLVNQRFEAIGKGKLSLMHNTFHGLLSFGGHVVLRDTVMQAPKAPTGWITRRRLHKLNRVYKLPKAVNFMMADDNCYLIRNRRLETLIDCKNVRLDQDSFRVWAKNAHLRLRPRWFAMQDASVMMSDIHLLKKLPNQFIRCRLNGKVSKRKPYIAPLKKTAIKKPVRHSLSKSQMMKILVGMMKTRHLLSDNSTTSGEIVKDLELIYKRSPTRLSVVAYLQSCLDAIRERIKNETPLEKRRDGKTITYADAKRAGEKLL